MSERSYLTGKASRESLKSECTGKMENFLKDDRSVFTFAYPYNTAFLNSVFPPVSRQFCRPDRMLVSSLLWVMHRGVTALHHSSTSPIRVRCLFWAPKNSVESTFS